MLVSQLIEGVELPSKEVWFEGGYYMIVCEKKKDLLTQYAKSKRLGNLIEYVHSKL